MQGSVIQVYLSDVLHAVSQALLAPDILLLLLFIGYALFCIGSVIAEYFSERRHFAVAMPKFLAALMGASEDAIPTVIQDSGLLKRQKIALLTVYDYRTLPGDALVSLIRRLVSEEESRFDRITGRNNMAARVSPMLGLMGTLIPLGPGIQALGNADTAALSSSLLIAFDTTVAGLVVAAVCLVVGKIRSNWYGNYMSALDSGMATMLEKIEEMRAEGKITVQEPSNYAFLFEQSLIKESKESAGKDESSSKEISIPTKPAEPAAPQQSAGFDAAAPVQPAAQDATASAFAATSEVSAFGAPAGLPSSGAASGAADAAAASAVVASAFAAADATVSTKSADAADAADASSAATASFGIPMTADSVDATDSLASLFPTQSEQAAAELNPESEPLQSEAPFAAQDAAMPSAVDEGFDLAVAMDAEPQPAPAPDGLLAEEPLAPLADEPAVAQSAPAEALDAAGAVDAAGASDQASASEAAARRTTSGWYQPRLRDEGSDYDPMSGVDNR